jgi:hypothetical protein
MIALLLSCAMCVPPTTNVDGILDAIQKVETGGCKDPCNAVGDQGKAIGPYQIHLVYWKDAVQYDPSIGGTYADCKDLKYARQIVIAYLSRYAPNWECETVARIHNGGPKGYLRSSTLSYWKKIKKVYND